MTKRLFCLLSTLVLIMALFLLVVCTDNQMLMKWFDINPSHISYDKDYNIIYNGNTYTRCDGSSWRAGEKGERLGAVSQWGDDLTFTHFGFEFEAGVFAVAGSNGAALHINPPNSEFDSLYLRRDISVPEISADSISRIEIFNEYMSYGHVVCDNGTTDKTVITEFIDLILNSQDANIAPPYSSGQTILLYSEEVPGCIYPVLLYEKDGVSFVEFEYKQVVLSRELLSKLGAAH